MFGIRSGSPRSHSLRPGSWPKPNFEPSDGRRISPSKRRTFCRHLRARVVARFPQTMLLPSSGIVLVISSFLMGLRPCWSCRKRTPKKRKVSAPKLSFALRQTSRLCGDGETGSDRHWPRSMGPKYVASFGTSRSAVCRSSASASCSVAMPSRSDVDLCSASNMLLMLNLFECGHGFVDSELSSQVAEGESPQDRGEY